MKQDHERPGLFSFRRNPIQRSGNAAAVTAERTPRKNQVLMRKIACAVLAFTVGALVAGTQAFPGTFPFGIALCCAASGTLAAISALAGSLVGCAGIPGVGGAHALVLTGLTAVRCGLSLWLAEERLPIDRLPDNRLNPNRIKNNSPGNRMTNGSHAASFARQVRQRKNPGVAGNGWLTALSNAQGIMLRESIRVRVALSACAALFAGAWSVVEGGYVYYDLFGAVFSFLTTPLVTYLFYSAGERRMRSSVFREPGIDLTAAVIALSLHRLSTALTAGSFFGVFDAGVLAAFLAAVVTSLEYGTHRGAILGLACGMTMTPAYAPMYAAAAVVAGTMARFSHTFAILCAGAAASAWAVFTGGLDGMTAALSPAAVGCAVLIPLYHYDVVRLPPHLFGQELTARRRSETAAMAELSDGLMKRRIASLSEGMNSVSAVLAGMAGRLSRPSKAEMREIAEAAFEAHCATCTLRAKCCDAKSSKTAPVIGKMAEELAREGTVSAAVIPPSLAASCWNMGRILDEINLTAGRRIAGMQEGDRLSVSAADFGLAGELLGRLSEEGRETSSVDEGLSRKLKRLLSYHDFGASTVTAYGRRQKHIFVGDVDLTATRMGGDEIRRLFENLAGTPLSQPEFELDGAVLSMRLHSEPSFGCRAGSFSCAASSVPWYYGGKRGCGADSAETDSEPAEGSGGGGTMVDVLDAPPDEVCGDGVTSFETDGRYYMILSDGMGSGKEAALTSGVVVSLLERMIRAGAELETALKMLNQIIRSAGRECSATVDIAQIDLLTGETRFVKSGAAPSFVLRDGSIYRLQSKTVPIGIIRALDAESIRFDVQAGDTVVMISDGVARSYEDAPWLLDLMTSSEVVLRGDERTAAMTIVSEAAIRGSRDDITAGVVRILRENPL